MMFKANGKPDYETQSDFLSAVMRFGAFTGLPTDKTIDKVLKGENEEFEKKYAEADGRDAEALSKMGFSGCNIGVMCASSKSLVVAPEGGGNFA